MGDDEGEEIILALKEVRRQAKRVRDAEVTDASNVVAFQFHEDMESLLRRFRAGLIMEQEMESQLERFNEEIRRLARQLDDPATMMGLDAEIEVAARKLGPAAEALTGDAYQAIREGVSKEKWISDVISGHAGNDAAQIACIVHIVELWRNGPWPWPREDGAEPSGE